MIVIGTEFTVPFGNNLVDDWKSLSLGGYFTNELSVSARLSSTFRR
jgi:hypothetical protein